ncbi:hypothetical protein O9929_15290 [Vibrio lentus]|nr:hypothetical protein [Vibrio lentus]
MNWLGLTVSLSSTGFYRTPNLATITEKHAGRRVLLLRIRSILFKGYRRYLNRREQDSACRYPA